MDTHHPQTNRGNENEPSTAQRGEAPAEQDSVNEAAPAQRRGMDGKRESGSEPAASQRGEGSVARALAVGALGGIAATTAMTLATMAAQKAGLLGRFPPKKITAGVLEKLGVDVGDGTTKLLSGLAHYGFGASMGALFGLAHGKTKGVVPASIEGIAYGTLIWAVAYKAVLPALGLMPPMRFDRPGRPTSMLFGHWVYGAVLGAAFALAPADSSKPGGDGMRVA